MDWEKFCKKENWHPDANLLPLMDQKALEMLAEDISDHGVQQPIVLFQNKVLDGRNRLRACQLKGVQLTSKNFETFHPNGFTPRQFVYTRNLHRRHLTVDQRAALAAQMVPEFQEEAKKRVGGRPKKGQKPSVYVRAVKGKSTELAANFVGGVSHQVSRKCSGIGAESEGEGPARIVT